MANKTRVQVRGTIGKSVKIPAAGVTQAQLAAAIAAIPASTTTATSSAAPSSGVTSVGLAAASAHIVIGGSSSPITGAGAFTVDLASADKTDIALAATAVQPGAIQNSESAGWNSTSGPVNIAFTVPQDLIVPFNCTLREVDIVTQGGTGSCTVKLWKAASLGLPNSGNDITGGAPPAISGGTSYANTTLSGWTTNFSQNDRILCTLSSNSVFTSVKIILRMY